MLLAQATSTLAGTAGSGASSGRGGARAVLPLAAAIAVVGVSFGALATAAGLTPTAAIVMSATTFAGSAQFAAVSVLSAGGAAATAVATAGLLNARYAATGVAVAPALRGGWVRRFLIAQLAVDESWAVAYLGDGHFSEQRLIGAGLVLFAAHVGSTAVGAFAGDVVGDPRALGLDAAFPALFLVLLSPHLRHRDGRVTAVLGAAIASAATPFLPAGLATLAAVAASLICARWR
jgi:4-azaleucine resistance transporter AzlC